MPTLHTRMDVKSFCIRLPMLYIPHVCMKTRVELFVPTLYYDHKIFTSSIVSHCWDGD